MDRLQAQDLATHVVGPLSFAVPAGTCAFLEGPSGTGKTLVLRALADLDSHDGEVYLDGVRAERYAPQEWRRAVGLLQADSAWWFDHVGEHFGAVNDGQLAALGFEPDVWDWRVDRLSSGERQRLALLRLLVNHPRVLLLDEPTANLDRVNIERVEGLLDDYRRVSLATLLWVSHDPEQIERIGGLRFRLADGRLTRHVGKA